VALGHVLADTCIPVQQIVPDKLSYCQRKTGDGGWLRLLCYHYSLEDVYRAGGISAILKTLAGKPGTLNLNCITVTGKTLGDDTAARPCKIATSFVR
jgi:hypothetical protein